MLDIGNGIEVEPIYTRLSVVHKWLLVITLAIMIGTGEHFRKGKVK